MKRVRKIHFRINEKKKLVFRFFFFFSTFHLVRFNIIWFPWACLNIFYIFCCDSRVFLCTIVGTIDTEISLNVAVFELCVMKNNQILPVKPLAISPAPYPCCLGELFSNFNLTSVYSFIMRCPYICYLSAVLVASNLPPSPSPSQIV